MQENEPNKKVRNWIIGLSVVSFIIAAYPQIILLAVYFNHSIPQNQLLNTFFKFFPPLFRDIVLIQVSSVGFAALAMILSLIILGRDKGMIKLLALLVFIFSALLLLLNVIQLL